MKHFALVIGGLLFTLFMNVSGEEKECPLKKAIEASIETCKDNLTEESLGLLEKDEDADNEEIRCFKACILKDSGMMEDGEIQIEKMKSVFNEAVEKAKEDKEKMKEMAKAIVEAAENCSKNADKGENDCEKAHLYIACLKEYKSKE